MEYLLYASEPYRNFTPEHWITLILLTFVYLAVIRRAICCLQENDQFRLWKVLSLVPLLSLVLRTLVDASLRPLSWQEDLPLHLCRILSLAAPLVAWSMNQKAIRIFSYLVLAGVVNAMITADIEFGFPHYGFILYWFYHASLVLMVLFGLFVFRIRPGLRDGWQAFLVVNAYFILLHLFNIGIDANYMYSRYKPDTASVMDFLGSWPEYLFWLEWIALGLIGIIYLGFRVILPVSTEAKSGPVNS